MMAEHSPDQLASLARKSFLRRTLVRIPRIVVKVMKPAPGVAEWPGK
jgi:hypothetical protein